MDQYANYNDFSSVSGGLLATLGIVAIVFFLIILAISIIGIAAQWKIFTKANQPGWASLIPIYNSYILCKIVGVNPWWIAIIIGSSFLSFIPVLGSILTSVISIYFMILMGVSTARAFGKEDGFAIGLVLLPAVFYPILGFGKAEYVGANNPMKDIIFKNNETNANSSNVKFCPSCGEKMDINSKFCPSCGKES